MFRRKRRGGSLGGGESERMTERTKRAPLRLSPGRPPPTCGFRASGVGGGAEQRECQDVLIYCVDSPNQLWPQRFMKDNRWGFRGGTSSHGGNARVKIKLPPTGNASLKGLVRWE